MDATADANIKSLVKNGFAKAKWLLPALLKLDHIVPDNNKREKKCGECGIRRRTILMSSSI